MADHDRLHRRGHGVLVGAHGRFGKVLERRRLVVPFHEFAHQRGGVLRAVDPFHARPARVGVDAVAAEDHHRHAVAPRVVDGHRSVLQADRAVHHHAHRFARGLGIAVRHGGGRLFVQAGDDLGILVAGVVDDGLLQAAEAGCRIDRDVLQSDGFQHVRHEVRAGVRDEGFARQFGGGGFGRGLRAFGRSLGGSGDFGAGGNRGAGDRGAFQKRAAVEFRVVTVLAHAGLPSRCGLGSSAIVMHCRLFRAESSGDWLQNRRLDTPVADLATNFLRDLGVL